MQVSPEYSSSRASNILLFSVAIPTYRRPDDLLATVKSVLANTRLPNELLIIDDESLSKAVIDEIVTLCVERGVACAYYRKADVGIRRGLSESKNWAAELVEHNVLCFLDDDVVLEKNYFDELLKEWKLNWSDEKLIGVGGRITNNRSTTGVERVFRKLFGLTGKHAWDVNDIGFQVWDESITETQRAHYIHGGVSSFRHSYLLAESFATFAGGRTGLEDVEYCLRAKRRGHYCLYVPSARLAHYPRQSEKETAFVRGKKESKNRRMIFLRHGQRTMYHRIWFAWANIGWILKKCLNFRFREAAGLLTGALI